MGMDVALRPAAAVALKGVNRPIHPAPWAARSPDAAERPAIAHEEVEYRHRVGRRPFTLLPRAIPADRARQGQPHQRGPVMKMHDRARPLAAPAENADAAIGQLPLDRSQREAAVHSVEHALKYPRGRPPQQPRPPPTPTNCPAPAPHVVPPPG